MEAPRQIKTAIALSSTVVVLETADRLWRISSDSDATTFTRLGFNLRIATLVSAVLVATFIFFAARRRHWARVALLVSTLAGWCLWLLGFSWFRTGAEYGGWRWLGYGTLTAFELTALVLLFFGPGARWYRAASGRSPSTSA